MADIPDESLQIALDRYLDRRLARLPIENEQAAWTFSPRFERKMQRLIRRARRKEMALALSVPALTMHSALPAQPVRPVRPKIKKRLLLAAIILALLVSLMSVAAAREAIIGFFVEVFENFSTIVFPSDPQTGAPDALPQNADEIQAWLPTAIPEGYIIGDIEITDFFIRTIYVNPTGKQLAIELLLAEKFQMQIDSENVPVEETIIGKGKALYYSNNGVQSLVWRNGSFVWVITGRITKDEAFYLVNSINP